MRSPCINTRNWLDHPKGRDVIPDASESLAFLGNCFDQDDYPFIYSTTQSPLVLPLAVPRLSSAERIIVALVSEVFGENIDA